MKTILVPLDGSALADRTLPYAVAIARATEAKLILFRAVVAYSYYTEDLAIAQIAAITEAEIDLDAALWKVRAQGVTAESRFVYGSAARCILEETTLNRPDMVVMSTHGRGGIGRWVYGSVTDRVLRDADVPVLIIPPAATTDWTRTGDSCVLVSLDGSLLAEEALEPARALAAALGTGLLLLKVVEPRVYGDVYVQPYAQVTEIDSKADIDTAQAYLDTIAARLSAQSVSSPGESVAISTRVETGQPTATVARVAHEVGSLAIALATHGRSGVARLVMGSVATGLLQRADVPVLLVRPAAVARPAPEPAVLTIVPSMPATPVPVVPPLTLSAQEMQMVSYGLELLLNTIDRDPRTTEPIIDLLARFQIPPPAKSTSTPATAPLATSVG